jgi:hypothetical protein
MTTYYSKIFLIVRCCKLFLIFDELGIPQARGTLSNRGRYLFQLHNYFNVCYVSNCIMLNRTQWFKYNISYSSVHPEQPNQSEFLLDLHIHVVIEVITKLPNSEQSYKGKVKIHNYINRQNQSTTGITFRVPCCDVRYDFRIKTMFGSSLLQVVYRRAHVLFTLFPHSAVQHWYRHF